MTFSKSNERKLLNHFTSFEALNKKLSKIKYYLLTLIDFLLTHMKFWNEVNLINPNDEN